MVGILMASANHLQCEKDVRHERRFEPKGSFFLVVWLALCVGFLVLGCSPVLNWRAVSLDSVELKVFFPCKPEHASKAMAFDESTLNLDVTGCKAGGGLFAVSTMSVMDVAVAAKVMDQWQRTMIHATTGKLPAEGSTMPANNHFSSEPLSLADPALAKASQWRVMKDDFVSGVALSIPLPTRLRVYGEHESVESLQWEGVWFAKSVNGRVIVIHMVQIGGVVGDKDNFFWDGVVPRG